MKWCAARPTRWRLYASLAATLLLQVAYPPMPTPALGEAAGKKPKASGPLEYVGKNCATAKDRNFRGAKTTTCVHWWIFPRTVDTDLENDYGIAWVQADVDPGPYCVQKVNVTVNLLAAFETFERAPNKSVAASSAKSFISALTSTADGKLIPTYEPGEVKQTWTLAPGRLSKPKVRNFAILKAINWAWTGPPSTGISLAVGLDLRWKTDYGLTNEIVFQRSAIQNVGAQVQPKFRRC